jgi:hypothetical protein
LIGNQQDGMEEDGGNGIMMAFGFGSAANTFL